MAKRKLPLTRIGLIGAVLATVAIIAWFFIHKPPVAVDLAGLDRGAVEVTVADDGVARVREVYSVASPVAGRLLRIDAEVGDAVVARETILARLAPADPGFLDLRSRAISEARVGEAQGQLAFAEADVRRAQAALSLARREYERLEPLAARGFVSRAALDRAGSARDEAAAALAAARAAAQSARSGLAAARSQLTMPLAPDRAGAIAVRAPVSGTVLRVVRESEAVVPAGTPLVEIGNPDGDLELVVDLLSTDAVRVRPGALVHIEGWGGSRPLAGRVRRVEPFGFLKISALGVEEQRVNVRIDLVGNPTSWARLGHGYRIDVRIVTDRAERVLRVPASALFRNGDQWAVFVNENGRARLRRIAVGLINETHAEVRHGLGGNEEVVLFPSETVTEGARLVRRAN
ncbi:MAG: efflux RND transporter periplasmic adaptor subunit [Allosphingosinicella sp.]